MFFFSQHDSGLARRLFGSLFCAIFSEVDHHLNETEAENTKTAMKQGINIVLESSTQFYSPFIGSLQVRLILILIYTLLKIN